MKLCKEIAHLISMRQEGPYWDFKKEWYGKEKDDDQLHDIICMANNLVNRDAYIIIGIDESDNFSVNDVRQDDNRRNTQKLTDFLQSKKFAGDFRPVVTVKSLMVFGGVSGDGMIDVIVVHNSLNTPFYLRERYKKVELGNIYVRLQDSNTPKNKTADFHNTEYLWKKRFGMLLSPIEKVKMYLQHPEDWEKSPSQEDKKYYKFSPEFTIEHNFEPEDGRNGYEYYLIEQTDPRPHWSDIKICYYQTVIADLGGVFLDGGRYFTAAPYPDVISLPEGPSHNISYKYMVKGAINYLVHTFYYVDDRGEAKHAHDSFEKCILFFENEDERIDFKDYVAEHWDEKDAYSEDILIPYRGVIPENEVNALEEEYRNALILKRMLEAFRCT